MVLDPVIETRGLGKAFDITSGPLRRIVSTLGNDRGADWLWALRAFDLSVTKGEAVGIVGLNGSGKSTLLQMVCGTILPTEGSVSVDGRIVAMLELGAGFNPDFTGRENALLSGIAYGLEASCIEARMGEIEAFADIGDYFERPVREYSSGMYVRLAFAVCANVDADILVVDEVLSVGDALFQSKCRRFIRDFLRQGTVLLVSHDAGVVRSLCTRAVLLENGRKTAEGPVDFVLDRYTRSSRVSPFDKPQDPSGDSGCPVPESREYRSDERFDPFWGRENLIEAGRFNPGALRHGHGGCRITSCHFTTDGISPAMQLRGGQRVTLHIEARAEREIGQAVFGFIFRNESGQNLFGDNTFQTYMTNPVRLMPGESGAARFTFQLPYLPLGKYGLSPSVIEGTQQDHMQLDWLEDALELTVIESGVRGGKVGFRHHDIRLIRSPS
ncbi:ABC transporter ATP-binding protein [Hoeflea sp.]|uniref:ABC transporter ATP-binding protein n=1 Tax=Hoeflea sp. TaxID=1940281 RepID=UPI003BB10503